MAWQLGRLRLKAADLAFAEERVAELERFEPHERMVRIQRMFIDQPGKPRNWVSILELLTLANSRAVREV